MPSLDMTIRIETPRWVAGFVVRDGIVCEAAPILRREFLGKPWEEAKKLLLKRKSYQFFILQPFDSC